MPKAYTSDWKLYGFLSCSRITSGAIQRMEPDSCSNWCEPLQRDFTVARPKSPIFTVRSSCRKMLLLLRSL
uniref:Uncharacterized protein n=1 Tax=Anguilla anguilla TaxID=7936 RepID=A0A0E9V8N9_ANGAN